MPRFSVMLDNLLEPEIFLQRWPESYDCYADPLRLLGGTISRLIETGVRRPGLDSFLPNSDDHELGGLDRCDSDYADESSGIYVRSCHRRRIAFHEECRLLIFTLQGARSPDSCQEVADCFAYASP